MIGTPPEPDPDDTYRWADERKTMVIWHQADSGIDYWVPVTPEGTPANKDWLLIKDWLDAGKVAVADPDPPPLVA